MHIDKKGTRIKTESMKTENKEMKTVKGLIGYSFSKIIYGKSI